MVRPFGTVGGKRKFGRLGVVGALLASTALVGLPEVRAAGELLEVTAGWTDYYMFNGSAISGDGTKVVGNGFDLALGDFRPALSTPDGLTRLATLGSFGRVNAISRTGERMVGYVTGPSGRDQAAIWAASGAVETIGTLHPLASTASSQAHDISGDGRRVVGQSLYSGMMRGFVWIEGATGGVADNEEMYQLPGLPASGRHIASAISDNGMFAVGESNGEAHTGRAVRWDLTTIEADGVAGIIDLGYFSGMGGYSSAFDVSADGRVVVGEASDADGLARAFRWVEGATTGVPDNPQMYDLGTLGGDRSWASAVSRNGSWVVGGSMINADESRAFRWSEEHGMESVGDWLARHGVDVGDYRLVTANGISDDGTVVVGDMQGDWEDGWGRAFIARVVPDPGPGPGPGPGIMDVTEYQQSLFSTTQIAHAGEFLTWLPLNGAHHRPLMQGAALSGDTCVWATGDLASHGGTRTGLGLAEVGACIDLAGGNLRIGGAIGTSHAWQQLALGGSSRLNGQYLLGEVDWQPDGTPLLLSLTGMLGGWQADIHRSYSNGAVTAYSDGSTGITGGVVRLRADWLGAATLGNTTINPWVSLAHGALHVQGFTESGGPFPARFDAQTLTSTDFRAGVTAETAISSQTTLSTTFEVAHRSGGAPAAAGNVIGLFDFSLGGGSYAQTWARVGAELDHKVNDALAVSASIHLASSGRDPSVAGSVGLKATF